MKVNTFVVSGAGWDVAIKDAGLQLSQAKQRVQQLEDVIAVFTEKMKSGEPWPVRQSEGQKSDSATQ